jgi:hypothetical protein
MTTSSPIRTSLTNSTALAQLTLSAWQIIYTALYNGITFSATEKDEALRMIRSFLIAEEDAEKAYMELAQRVLLTRQYLQYHASKYLPAPTQWLSPNNPNGFPGTRRWYEGMLQQRQKEPLYKITYKAFAEAILEMHIEPTAANFHYWRSYFLDRHCQALLNLFLSTIANMKFDNE